ncbi:unnamed protein product, partial [Amoebophrya sp. A25]|eukprot:GSA25T00022458001.1
MKNDSDDVYSRLRVSREEVELFQDPSVTTDAPENFSGPSTSSGNANKDPSDSVSAARGLSSASIEKYRMLLQRKRKALGIGSGTLKTKVLVNKEE